jgi:D-alanyl-D-alanine carboxypeptidase
MKIPKLKKNVYIVVPIVLVLLISFYLVINNPDQSNQETVSEETTQEVVEETSEPQLETKEETPVEKAIEENLSQPSPTPEPTTSQWPVLLSIDEASSVTVVVNKKHKLPENYAPGLRSITSNALSQLTNAATNAGIKLKTISSYRSYSTQVSTYNKWVNQSGQAAADTFSARPGHSEHQTGLAVDVGASNGTCDLETCFGNTPEGKWVAANAQNYGFIIRYPNGKDAITGYQYEPWHLRYVGVDIAKAVVASGLTLDQYFGIEGGGYN